LPGCRPCKSLRAGQQRHFAPRAGAKASPRRLGVRYLVEGSVRRAGARLRVSAQLIDASQDVHCWAGNYNGTIEDVFSIQEQIARKIVAALELRLSENEERGLSERAINSIPAYECYLRARHEMWRWRRRFRLTAPYSCSARLWRSSAKTRACMAHSVCASAVSGSRDRPKGDIPTGRR